MHTTLAQIMTQGTRSKTTIQAHASEGGIIHVPNHDWSCGGAEGSSVLRGAGTTMTPTGDRTPEAPWLATGLLADCEAKDPVVSDR